MVYCNAFLINSLGYIVQFHWEERKKRKGGKFFQTKTGFLLLMEFDGSSTARFYWSWDENVLFFRVCILATM